MTMDTHLPVLLAETLEGLNPRLDGLYVDATFGRGGHAAAILERLGPSARLLALDRDPDAARCAAERFSSDPRVTFMPVAFSRLAEVIAKQGWAGRVDGILLDLGVSSPQLNDSERGFSFRQNGPLDMRMNPATGVSAADWLSRISEAALDRVLVELGEERFHRRVAHAIIAARQQGPVTTTAQLAALIAAAVPTREPGQHPATRAFQAIRIAVNDELGELAAVLPQAVMALRAGGRLAVISFHSLEDRMVKRFMREQAHGQELPPGLPVMGAPQGMTLRLIGRLIRPGSAEIAANPRARSALLRIAERLA
ncbi:MAG: 16S rRNA (cytosine(1402)-N(4))-methyltransferase RsmH [Candidatus Contendobacter sp.]|jgi:16S rRNA (cytosine1402-N4)-methyltransferase|nr:16S rRNA (cytosine(1402)-N(4))-methyltransferase RsmH [Gammaproteobacteria bacterium]MCC8993337.1 16S rRNA (cytosine(1402)-N(4))-methyltransferase RsmH [Candidatus Contendobacter sp.]